MDMQCFCYFQEYTVLFVAAVAASAGCEICVKLLNVLAVLPVLGLELLFSQLLLLHVTQIML
jgi:hypothetical protein